MLQRASARLIFLSNLAMINPQLNNYLFGGHENMKRLFDQIDWKALQAFIMVMVLPVMVVFGGITILLFNP